MADYSACENISCDKRGNCARYRMIWGPRQSISCFPTKEICEYQMPIDDPRGVPFKIQSLVCADIENVGASIANTNPEDAK